jgi:cytoskeletal protein CcmA (bactofilin family)
MRETRAGIAGRTARAWLVAIAGVLTSLALASPAVAQDAAADRRDDDHVVLTGGLVVPEGETVGTVVVFNGPVVIEGTVTESVVVFNGRTEISGTVDEDVVVFNGRVLIRSGAEVGGNVSSREDPEIEEGATVRGKVESIANRVDFENLGFAGRIAWWIGYSVSTLILGLLLLMFAPRFDVAIADVVRSRMGAAFGFGAAAFFLVPIVAVILLVTIVGIPLGLFVLLALALLYTLGYVAGAHALGRLLVKPPRSRFLAYLAGLGILRLVALVPFLGGLVWLVASIFGLGALVVAARRPPAVVVETSTVPPPPAMVA